MPLPGIQSVRLVIPKPSVRFMLPHQSRGCLAPGGLVAAEAMQPALMGSSVTSLLFVLSSGIWVILRIGVTMPALHSLRTGLWTAGHVACSSPKAPPHAVERFRG